MFVSTSSLASLNQQSSRRRSTSSPCSNPRRATASWTAPPTTSPTSTLSAWAAVARVLSSHVHHPEGTPSFGSRQRRHPMLSLSNSYDHQAHRSRYRSFYEPRCTDDRTLDPEPGITATPRSGCWPQLRCGSPKSTSPGLCSTSASSVSSPSFADFNNTLHRCSDEVVEY